MFAYTIKGYEIRYRNYCGLFRKTNYYHAVIVNFLKSATSTRLLSYHLYDNSTIHGI